MNAETQQNPYAPPEARVSDFRETGDAVELAGRGTRLGAAMIDGLIFGSTVLPILIAAGFETSTVADPSAYLGLAGLVTLALLIAILAVTIVFVHRNGQTIGKRLVDIKVVRSDGTRASLGRIFWLRNFINWILSAIPVIGGLYSLADPLFIFGDQRRCIHDLIADTIVVNT